MKAKIDWRREMVKDVCSRCIYYDFCEMNIDCQALKILVKIHEDMDSGNPDE